MARYKPVGISSVDLRPRNGPAAGNCRWIGSVFVRTFMGLHKNISTEPVSALNMRPFVSARPDQPVRQVVSAMKASSVGAAIVMNGQQQARGLFTEKMLIRLLVERPEALDEPIQQHMSRRIVTIGRDQPIARLIRLMQQEKIRWVVVADDQGRAEALTGHRGAIAYVADHFPHLVKVQPIKASMAMQQREGA